MQSIGSTAMISFSPIQWKFHHYCPVFCAVCKNINTANNLDTEIIEMNLLKAPVTSMTVTNREEHNLMFGILFFTMKFGCLLPK